MLSAQYIRLVEHDCRSGVMPNFCGFADSKDVIGHSNVCLFHHKRHCVSVRQIASLVSFSLILVSLSKRRFCQHGRQPKVSCFVIDGE